MIYQARFLKQLRQFFALIFGCALIGISTAQHVSGSAPESDFRVSQSEKPLETTLDYVEILVNGSPITHTEILMQEQNLDAQGIQAPLGSTLYEVALEQLITQKVLLIEAKQSGIQVSDTELAQAVTAIAQENQLSEAQLRQNLYAQGQSFSSFRENLRQEIALNLLQQQQRAQFVTVTEDEITAQILELEQLQQLGNAAINLGHILVLVPLETSASQRSIQEAKVRHAYQSLANGIDFAQVASRFSEAAEGPLGGELGLRPLADYPQFFLEAVQEIPVGGITSVLRSPAGYHILKVLERQGSKSNAPLARTKTHAQHILLAPNQRERQDQAYARLLDFKQQIESKQADFTALARAHSQDGTADRGGDLGWVISGQLVPELESAMNALAIGEISDPVISRFGTHLIKVLEREEEVLSEEDIRALAEKAAREKKQEENLQKWGQSLRDKAFIEKRGAP